MDNIIVGLIIIVAVVVVYFVVTKTKYTPFGDKLRGIFRKNADGDE